VADIFVNFRNGDDPFAAALIYRALGRRFGRDAVFRSSESIPPGSEWAETIWDNLRSSRVVVAVIGPRWLTVADRTGQVKLRQPGDWVHDELALALEQRKLVIMVMLDGTARLSAPDLPEDLARLVKLQTVPMDHRRVEATVRTLIEMAAPLVGAANAAGRTGAGFDPADADWLAVWNVPPGNPSFVERGSLLTAVRTDLRQAAGGGPVVLHGEVGTGKTWLATEYAHRNAGDYELAWWISADRPDLIPAQFAALAHAVRFDAGPDIVAALPALFGQLRRRGSVLLVFDGVPDPAVAAPYLAAVGVGVDILVTSRASEWGLLATTRRRIPGFDRDQSVRLLAGRLDDVAEGELDGLAHALDDIPLAVAQASVFLTDSPVSVPQYIGLLETRPRALLGRGETYAYPGSLARAWSVGLEHLAANWPGALELLELLSVFGPARVPFAVFEAGAQVLAKTLGPPLDRLIDDPLAVADLTSAIARTGLISAGSTAFRPNALFQAFLRDGLAGARTEGLRESARRALARVPRRDPRAPQAWPEYSALLPHAFALDLGASPDPECRRHLLDVVHHLVVRSDAVTARTLAATALERWRGELGPDDPAVLDAAAHLAQAYFRLGDHARAVELDLEVYARRRAASGEGDPATLAAAHNLAIDRWAAGGDRAEARSQFEQIADLRCKALGDQHPDTLRSEHNVALALRAVGELRQARELDERNHRAMVTVLGEDHPDTLRSAYALALDLRALGENALALSLESDTHSRLTRTLGADHPDTLRSAYGVAVGLRMAGELVRARSLAEETYERRVRTMGDQSTDTLRSEYLLGLILTEAGEQEAGARLLSEAGIQLAVRAAR
jgi:tetratricopeptide (TPR) repeat protein